MLRHMLFVAVAMFTSVASAQSTARTQYTDPYGYFTTDAQYEAWYSLRARLATGFDDVCGDTFCEGDFSNIASLRFECSVQRGSGRIGSCVWSFAASSEEIVPTTGRIEVLQPTWQCPIPVAPHTTIDALLAALAGEDPLHAPLPGTTLSVYDGLTHCL